MDDSLLFGEASPCEDLTTWLLKKGPEGASESSDGGTLAISNTTIVCCTCKESGNSSRSPEELHSVLSQTRAEVSSQRAF